MFKYLLFPLSILLLNTWIVAGIFECCPGENNVIFLSNSSCGDKELNINATINLNCSIKIPLAREDWEEYGFIKVFDNGTILDNSMKETKFILDLVNTLQGVLIFLILVVFRKRVRRELANKNLCNIKFPNSWKYLEDEEMDSAEQKTNGTILCYRPSEDVDAEI
ncbi:hypothetical protein D910_03663 [Dendroctonus ponderosae]